MRLYVLLVVFMAASLYAQITAGLSSSVDYMWLGARWAQLPKFPGDAGVLTLSFYTSQQHIDVSISITPRCLYLTPLEVARLPSAGPGVVNVNLKVSVAVLNYTCPVNVVFKSRHVVAGSTLGSGVERVEHADIYIPPYPTAEVKTVGLAYLNTPSRVSLAISSPYLLTGLVSIQGVGARVVTPIGPVPINGTRSIIDVVVIADSPAAALRVDISTRDWLGNPVTLTYTVPLAAAPPPPPLVEIAPGVLYANRYNDVNMSITLPLAADGSAVVTITGGVAQRSSYTIPIVGGRGFATLSVYPVASTVTFTVQITYVVGGVVKTDTVSLSAAVQQAFGGAARVDVRPSRLLAGLANNMTIVIRAPGVFNASITVGNAAVDKALPLYVGGRDEAATSIYVTPLSTQPVSVVVNIYTTGGVEQYQVNIPVVSSSIFTVVPTPSLVVSGGNRTVVLTIVNSGDLAIEKAVVTISPGSPSVIASTYSYQLGRLKPLESVQLPISFIAPVTLSGAVPFTYNIIYTTELGTVGAAQGTFYIQAIQVPAVNITGATVVPAVPEPRRIFYISLTVVNRGFSQISNLQVEASTPRGVRPVTSPIYFAGALDPQQTASIPMSFNASAPGVYEIRFTISFTDVYGNVYTIPHVVTVTVANSTSPRLAPQSPSTTTERRPDLALPAAIGIAAVAAGVGLYLYKSKRRL